MVGDIFIVREHCRLRSFWGWLKYCSMWLHHSPKFLQVFRHIIEVFKSRVSTRYYLNTISWQPTGWSFWQLVVLIDVELFHKTTPTTVIEAVCYWAIGYSLHGCETKWRLLRLGTFQEYIFPLRNLKVSTLGDKIKYILNSTHLRIRNYMMMKDLATVFSIPGWAKCLLHVFQLVVWLLMTILESG